MSVDRQNNLCELPDNFGLQFFIPGHAYIPVGVLVVDGCKLYSRNCIARAARGTRDTPIPALTRFRIVNVSLAS